jgi:hypothetical protein
MTLTKRKMVAALTASAISAAFPAAAGNGSMRNADGAMSGGWAVMKDTTLKQTLETWSKEHGWQVIWDNPVDYRIRASVILHGGFEEAVGRLVDSIHQSNPSLAVTLYRGNKVIHVTESSISSQ